MTDKKNASLAQKSEARKMRYRARAALGLKPGDPRQADHKHAKHGGKYNNAKSNLQALSPAEHKRKSKSEPGGTGGRPKGKATSSYGNNKKYYG